MEVSQHWKHNFRKLGVCVGKDRNRKPDEKVKFTIFEVLSMKYFLCWRDNSRVAAESHSPKFMGSVKPKTIVKQSHLIGEVLRPRLDHVWVFQMTATSSKGLCWMGLGGQCGQKHRMSGSHYREHSVFHHGMLDLKSFTCQASGNSIKFLPRPVHHI